MFPASGNFTTTLGSAATASNTFIFPAGVFTTLHLGYCVTSGTTCTWTDTGYPYNAIPNADLANSAITIGGTSVSLGGSTSSFPSPGAIGGTTQAAIDGTTITAHTHFLDQSLTASLPVCSDASKNLSSTCTNLIPISDVGSAGLSGTSPVAISSAGAISINANGITATQLAAQYSKGSCTEAWGGSGTSHALASGDDAVVNNTCYNDSGVTRTITAVKCRSDAASNSVTVNPSYGSAGTGTSILTGAVTCGNSYAYSATGTLGTGSAITWTTGTGIDPVMAGTLTGSTSIAMIVEYTY